MNPQQLAAQLAALAAQLQTLQQQLASAPATPQAPQPAAPAPATPPAQPQAPQPVGPPQLRLPAGYGRGPRPATPGAAVLQQRAQAAHLEAQARQQALNPGHELPGQNMAPSPAPNEMAQLLEQRRLAVISARGA
jgi:hypothetical protein